MHVCSAAATMLTAAALPGCRVEQLPLVNFERVQLVDGHNRPLMIDSLQPEQEYIFFYPYVSTPCFLLDLGTATHPVELQTAGGRHYQWQGGTGPNASIVAFAAICAHKLSYPSKPVSFIGYRQQPIGFLDKKNNKIVQRSAVIQCCSEHSIYDPAEGARVLSGPAPQPLTSVALEEQGGELFVTGVYGGLVYDRFFERFGFRLELDFGEKARELVSGTAWVRTTQEFTQQRIQC
jgi:Rieske Fe-S protein